MEQKGPMTHKVFVDDTIQIRRELEVPERCPGCRRHYNLGDTVMKAVTLRPKEETLHLSTVLAEGTRYEVASIKDSITMPARSTRLVLEMRCLACGYLHAVAHSRMYKLAEMDRLTAFKLRGLLYDNNAVDPQIRRKCFEENEDYHGDCLACNIEADIGTEEVPHPIDPRVHTCVRDPEHVKHQPE